ncbi:MAG: M1 family metallopeptidase [Fimbriimonadaceae bacterium]|nr:M1 family metallopeptidase [Chitinophagales bacterium]
MKKILISISVFFIYNFLNAQSNIETACYVKDPKGNARNHNVDFQNLNLDIRFEPEKGKVFGVANYTFTPLQQKVDSLFLDGIKMTVHEILLDGAAPKYKTDSAGITIYFSPALTWETKHTLQIDYTATPKKGIYFIGWQKPITAKTDDPNRTRKQIWTQGQGTDNRYWIPGYDEVNDKLITALNISFDRKYEVISNGNLSGKNNIDENTITWRYAMDHPHALYLIMLAIGEYDHKDYVSKNGIISRQYYYPDRKDAVEITYQHTAEMMDWLQNEVGVKYPWQSYSNIPVQEFLYGAMENTTATVYTDYFLQDARSSFERDYDAINAHELTHQWFGDYVTEYSGTSHWLHESFATYYSKIFMRTVEGDDAYAWERRKEMLAAINADNQNEYPLAHSQAGSSRHYQKGSYVLDMLRYVSGDAQFQKVIKEYLLAHPYENVSTYDLQLQFIKTLGMNLDWFFDEWVYKSGYPIYDVSYTKNSQTTSVTVKQTQKITSTAGLFKMPVHLQVFYLNGTNIDTLVWVEKTETQINIINKNFLEVAYVLFDPGTMVCSKVNFKKEFPELMIQAVMAPNYIDRYDAVTAMKNTPIETKREGLIKVYHKESHFAIKTEIITQLINDTDKSSLALIKSALQDKDASVRQAVLTSTTSIPKKLIKDYEAMLNDFSYVNVELGLRLLCKEFPAKKEKYLAATITIYGMNKNVRIAWLEIYYSIDKTKHIKELVDYAGYSYEFRTRNKTFDALKAINYCDTNVVNNLFDAAISPNSRLAGPARGTLQFFMQTPEYYTLIRKTFDETKWEDWQKRRVEVIFQGK